MAFTHPIGELELGTGRSRMDVPAFELARLEQGSANGDTARQGRAVTWS